MSAIDVSKCGAHKNFIFTVLDLKLISVSVTIDHLNNQFAIFEERLNALDYLEQCYLKKT